MTSSALVIVQARMGSTRFPGKSMAEIDGKPILWYLFRQLSYCRSDISPVLATTNQPGDDALADYAVEQGWNLFRGSETDVLKRYYDAATAFGAADDTIIVRITGDDIWPDPQLVDAAVNLHAAFIGLIDCVFTADDGNLPYGVYLESYRYSALRCAHRETDNQYDREHVSPFIKRNRQRFPRLELSLSERIEAPPISIDKEDDLERNAQIAKSIRAVAEPPYRLFQILEILQRIIGPDGKH